MIGRNSDTHLVIIVGVILFLSYVPIFSSGGLISNAYAQEKATNVESDEIKAMLLRPDGWLGEWRGTSYEGVIHLIFEDRGENVVVKINNPTLNTGCERNVTITSGDIKLDGCYDTNILLRFDPKDQEYPFKGESKTTNYKLKPK
jgi:hypothetical protein